MKKLLKVGVAVLTVFSVIMALGIFYQDSEDKKITRDIK